MPAIYIKIIYHKMSFIEQFTYTCENKKEIFFILKVMKNL